MLGDWLHFALADLCCLFGAFGGAKANRNDYLKSWGIHVAQMDEEQVREKRTQEAVDWLFRRA